MLPKFAWCWALTLGCAACLPRQSGDQSEVAPDVGETEAARSGCSPSSDAALAVLEPSASMRVEAPCGVTLELEDGALVLRPIPRLGAFASGPPILARGPSLESCGPALERCELWGVHDELGPVVLASVRGPESEVPIQVYVGWVEGDRLVFSPTWFGLPSVVDHTRVGPPWALAPHDCRGGVVLLPAPRLPEAAAEQPTEALRAAAGRWTLEAGELAQREDLAAFEAVRCRPLFAALP
jgi:hypothetical protein